MNIHHQLEANQSRRMKAEDRYLDRIQKRESVAESMIGELVREGKAVHYAFPAGGKYREGAKHELIAFLIKNRYA